ncbi:shikimate O-hydroxycinnamoyltransferase [Olea europaea var. sylvestris]|uniref:shikimate O-hydroxycinnamoyltransferase n=1 Tax=Olea europaea var. sylvestris TaxID=158386 RepID=UPI000C1D11E7|nr:shikimate O-hydroxycinnamoyltransferase [Olea europaea var. sylvestris]
MAHDDANYHGNFEVKFIRKTVVKAAGSLPETHIITLSNLDLLSGRFPVTYVYFYSKTPNIHLTVATLKSSLAQCLRLFYPFSGRMVQNPQSNEPEIMCDNSGALVVEAQTNISLKEFNFYNIDEYLKGKLVSVDHNFPVKIQITGYACRSMAITFTFDHALGDATAFSKFLVTWCEIANKKLISCSPNHSRALCARVPPSYDPLLTDTFASCTLDDIRTIPTISMLLKRLYYIPKSSIDMMQKLACINGAKRTKIESFSAYVWKVMVNAIDKKHKNCKMGWLVDGRTRIRSNDPENSMSNYIGNVLSVTFGESTVNHLNQGSIADIANVVHNAISKITNEEHFRDLIDWIECHRPGLMLAKSVLGLDVPTLVISSGRRFPVAELDFGFGSPVLGTVCSTIERLGVGYMNQRESARGDGSWTVSAILWPEMVAALESDPSNVFRPMNSSLLQL